MGKTNKRKKGTDLFWRIAVSAVGAALILIAAGNLLLFFFGNTAVAAVTTRRVGGSDDGKPAGQRYEWYLDYTFTDNIGVEREGHTTRRGSDTSVQTDTVVYYFTFAPFIHTLESDAKPGFTQPIFIALGVLLIVVMNRKKKKTKHTAIKKPLDLTDYDDSAEELFHHDD